MAIINRHHVFYEKGVYNSNGNLKTLRNHSGLIIPIYIPDHRDLHHNLDNRPYSRHTPSVPKPAMDAVVYFNEVVVLPYEPGQPRTRTLDQAIGWFAMTGNESTAEHLALQREFILKTELIREVNGPLRVA